MNEKREEYVIDCGYPLESFFGLDSDLDSELHELAGHSISSGCGVGYRDIQWNRFSETEAKELAEAIYAIFKKKGIPTRPINSKFVDGYAWVSWYKVERR